ncbi:MAG TPA: hypothetical protein VFO41_15035 [Alphaproteobacteria bacterium]|nr:hypothetical protein [Alphaproteobacteria bacterium]
MKAYEELVGSTGSRIHYQAERHDPRALFRQAEPVVRVGGSPVHLRDFSLSGLTVTVPRGKNVDAFPGDEARIEFELCNRRFYEGSGRILDVSKGVFETSLDLVLTTGYLDLPQMISHYEEATFRRELEVGLEEAEQAVAPEYRQLCADILHLLRRYRFALERFETKLKGHASLTDARMAEMLALCEERIRPEWRTLWHRANALVEPILGDRCAMDAYKRLTELVLTPEFSAAPIWRRSYQKPLGYPGDFQIMKMVYSWQRQGETPFARLVHFLGLDALECVATRMVVVQQSIMDLLQRNSGQGPVRITNLGAGSAQEVRNVLSFDDLPSPVALTLVDQDRTALAETYHEVYPDVVRHKGRAAVDCLHVSFVELMRAGELFGHLPMQDMIYSVGLFDYLGQRRAKTLAATLFDQLLPGGTLLIGNLKRTPVSGVWPGEFVCDWSMIYRSEAEMLDLADGLDAERIDLRTDKREQVYLLSATKRS